jgi:hypothetical protein
MSNFTAGLDLGQQNDFSALIVCEHTLHADGGQDQIRADEYGQRYVERVPLWKDAFDVVGILRWRGTPYDAIVSEVCRLMGEAPLRDRVSLTVDATGVGRPVLDLFDTATREGRLGFWSQEVTITAGQEEGQRGRSVPKFALIQNVEVLGQTRRLKVLPSLPLAPALMEELKGFRAKMTLTGHVRWEGEGGLHDDLVIALALATWKPKWTGSPRHLLESGEWYNPDEFAPVGEPIYLPVRG